MKLSKLALLLCWFVLQVAVSLFSGTALAELSSDAPVRIDERMRVTGSRGACSQPLGFGSHTVAAEPGNPGRCLLVISGAALFGIDQPLERLVELLVDFKATAAVDLQQVSAWAAESFDNDKLKTLMRQKNWLRLGSLGFLLAVAIIAYLIHINYRLRVEMRKRVAVEEKLRELAETDGLTGIDNRHKFNLDIGQEFYRARRYHQPLSLLIFDIDRFKRINDRFGHIAGDEVLKAMARITREMLRNSDKFARFGGEEFVIILPNTEVNYALALAERLRAANSDNRVTFGDCRIGYTISIGLAQLQETDRDSEALFKRSDDALYTAKHSGRDCIRVG